MRMISFLWLLLCLLLAVSCQESGPRVTAYRGTEGTLVDLSSPRTLTVSDCGADSVNLFVGSDGILTRYLVGTPNPWYDAACAESLERGHYRYFFAEDDAMWFFNLECNCNGQ
ncbi:MAG: hypothetical protein IKX28_08380 [Bacteroidales bacterium]|nr:hypothetical protein [Bacteroidales bacterium]